MAPKGWTKDDQRGWLTDRRPASAEARRLGRFATWVISIQHDWFLRWPERREIYGDWQGPLTLEQTQELAQAIQKRKQVRTLIHCDECNVIATLQQIINWFNNRNNRTRDTHTLPASVTAALMKAPRKHCPQPREVYCRLFYNEAKRSIVKNDLLAERQLLGRKLTRKERMTISRQRIDAWYEAEPEDVKAQVLARLEEEKKELSSVAPASTQTERTPQEYQK